MAVQRPRYRRAFDDVERGELARGPRPLGRPADGLDKDFVPPGLQQEIVRALLQAFDGK